MATVIYVAAIGGIALLMVATFCLVKLNLSEKTLEPVLSILLVGTATTLVAVGVQLKQSTIESTFSTSVVIDTVDGGPASILISSSNPKLTSRLSDLVMLGHPAVNRDGKTEITIQKPTNVGERFTFGGELLQYKLALTIRKLQRGGKKFGQVLGTSFASVTKPIKLSDSQDYPFWDSISSNRFSDSDMERFAWEHALVPLPKDTNVSLIHLSPPSTGSTEQFTVRLHKPLYFNIDFVIEPLGGTGMGILPSGVVLAPELAARCETYQYQITMKATFDRITAGNSRTQEYKDWAAALFAGVRDDLGDQTSPSN